MRNRNFLGYFLVFILTCLVGSVNPMGILPEWYLQSENPALTLPYQYPTGHLKPLFGFSYCSHLDGSYFDMSTPIDLTVVSRQLDSREYLKSHDKQFIDSHVLYRVGSDETLGDIDVEESIVPAANVDPEKIILFIDSAAKHLSNKLLRHYELQLWGPKSNSPVSRLSAKEFACFLVADGSNDWVSLVPREIYRKFLRFIDGSIYFGGVPNFNSLTRSQVELESSRFEKGYYGYKPNEIYNPATDSEMPRDKIESEESCDISLAGLSLEERYESPRSTVDTLTIGNVKPHRLAYLLLVHKNFKDVARLIDALLDPYVSIVVHVDAKNSQLKHDLIHLIRKRSKRNQLYNRVRIMRKTVRGAWGHASLASAQMAGFFELLDFDQNWEFVVNLSGNDYPLRHNDIMYEDLKKNYDGKNLIQYWTESSHTTDRLNTRPFLLNDDGVAGLASHYKPTAHPSRTGEHGMLLYPYPEFTIFGHHQWMILHRSFIEWMRSSPVTMQLLAYAQFTVVPDENLFGTIALNSPFQTRVVNNCKRYLWFPPGAPHPKTITMNDFDELKNAASRGDGWTRKIELSCSGDLLECINRMRDEERDRTLLS